jgi:hypothetical protein
MAKQINTPLQDMFLNCLFDDDVKGDIRKAMKKAGYAETTPSSAVVGPLKDQILERSKQFLALNAGKAVYAMVNVLDSPNALGAKNAISAANEVLDRVGVVKQDNTLSNLPKGAIVLLPPKKQVPMIEAEYTVIEAEADEND